MNFVHLDTLQTTAGPCAPPSILQDECYLYGYRPDVGLVPVAHDERALPDAPIVSSAMLITLSAKNADGTPKTALVPWDADVLMATDHEWRPAHELLTGDKVAYFTRVMRHEKYSAMRVIPYMPTRLLEHRWVWEAHSGMDIPATHSVDHIDGNSYNNAFTNLRSLDIKAHSRMTAYRQRNRHTRRNADGSFAKGSTTTRVASADQPIPAHLDTGQLSNTCRVVSMEEADLGRCFFAYTLAEDLDATNTGIIYGGLVVQP